jgi:hypothetical protein
MRSKSLKRGTLTADSMGVSASVSRIRLAGACVVVVYAAVRVWMFVGARPLLTPDSHAYLRIAREPLLSLRFFSEYKPWFVPAFYKAAGESAHALTWAQLVLSIVAWLFLASALAYSVRNPWLRVVVAVAVLLFSLSPVIAQWDAAVLSESLSLSLAAIFVGLLLVLLRHPTTATAALLGVVAACWAGTRDTNAYVVVLVLVPVAVVLLVQHRPRVGVALVAIASLVLVFSLWSASSPRRWEIVSVDLVIERVLGDAHAESYFRAHGMPVLPGLRARLFADRTPWSRYESDPQLVAFRRWIRTDSRPTYLSYLRDTPSASISTPMHRLAQLNSPDVISLYRPHGFRTLMPGELDRLVYLPSGGVVFGWSLLALASACLLAAARRLRAVWIVGALLVLTTVPQAILVWDAEPREVGRHALLVGTLDRVGLLILAALVFDALLTLMQERRALARVRTAVPA